MRAISISIIKNTVRSIVLLGTSIAMGTVLLCLVYMLPMAPIKRHVFEDVKLLQGEGNYTVFWEGTFVRMHPNNISIETFFLNNRGMARDNYTDAIMLGNAAYEDESKSIPEKALCVYRYAKENEMPIDSLQVYLESGRIDSEISYSRYWHGYLVFLKPLLCFFTYVQIRIINVLLQSVLLVFLCREIVRKIGGEYATSLFGAVLMVFPFAIPFCMQYCTAVYVMLVSSIIYLRHYGYWSRKERTLLFYDDGHSHKLCGFFDISAHNIGGTACDQRADNRRKKLVYLKTFLCVVCRLFWDVGRKMGFSDGCYR